MELYTNMTTTLHFLLLGVTTAIPVGPHELEPDGAGCLMYSGENLLERRILEKSFREVERRLNSTSSIRLYWRDVRVCPVSDSIVHLVLHGQPYELLKVDDVSVVGEMDSVDDADHDSYHLGATEASSTATSIGSPHDHPTPEVVEGFTARESSPMSHQRQQAAVVRTEGRVGSGGIPSLAIYENAEPIDGFARVMMVIQAGMFCSFKFLLNGNQNLWTLGPYRMVIHPSTGCLVYDTIDAIGYQKAKLYFELLSSSLAGKGFRQISAEDNSVCFPTPMEAEFTIGKERYRMTLKSIPEKAEKPTKPPDANTNAHDLFWRGNDMPGSKRDSFGVEAILRPSSLSISKSAEQSGKKRKKRAAKASTGRPRKRLPPTPVPLTPTGLPPTGQPLATVYESVSPFLGFVKVTMKIGADSSRTFCFFPPGKERPFVVGPLAMVVKILTGCYMFDTINPSNRGAVTAAFIRFSKVLGWSIYGDDIEVCYRLSMEVELVIKKVSYPMRPSSIPDLDKSLGPGPQQSPGNGNGAPLGFSIGGNGELGNTDIPSSTSMAHANTGVDGDVSLGAPAWNGFDPSPAEPLWNPTEALDFFDQARASPRGQNS